MLLLTNSSLYNQESVIQSNCVKGYVGRVGSIIISLRKEGEESDERATIEYYLSKENEKINANRVQSLGRFNYQLTHDWDEAVEKLDKIMSNFVKDKRYENVKLIKECSNGIVFNSESEWDENGRLQWVKENIHNNGYTLFGHYLEF